MCGRFVNLNKIEKLNKVFQIDKFNDIENNISYNVAPAQSTIIITNIKSFNIEKANWGYKFFDKKNNLEKNIINSRLETINEKILFKESFEKRKCIIPANGFYEWTIKDNLKIPYFIHIPHLEPIYFAGIWKNINIKKNDHKVFSIITKESNAILKKIHKRMPVTLSINEAMSFLEINNSFDLNHNFSSTIEEYFTFFKVSKFVNNPINNSSTCIQPIN